MQPIEDDINAGRYEPAAGAPPGLPPPPAGFASPRRAQAPAARGLASPVAAAGVAAPGAAAAGLQDLADLAAGADMADGYESPPPAQQQQQQRSAGRRWVPAVVVRDMRFAVAAAVSSLQSVFCALCLPGTHRPAPSSVPAVPYCVLPSHFICTLLPPWPRLSIRGQQAAGRRATCRGGAAARPPGQPSPAGQGGPAACGARGRGRCCCCSCRCGAPRGGWRWRPDSDVGGQPSRQGKLGLVCQLSPLALGEGRRVFAKCVRTRDLLIISALQSTRLQPASMHACSQEKNCLSTRCCAGRHA